MQITGSYQEYVAIVGHLSLVAKLCRFMNISRKAGSRKLTTCACVLIYLSFYWNKDQAWIKQIEKDLEKVEFKTLVKNNKDGSFNTMQVKEHENLAQNRHIRRLIVDRAMSL